jgi:hypothetical protein
MGRRRRDNIHKVRLFLLQHLSVVFVVAPDAVILHDRLCTLFVAVAERRHSDFRNPLPGLILEVTEIPRPDRYGFERTHYYSLSDSVDVLTPSPKSFTST